MVKQFTSICTQKNFYLDYFPLQMYKTSISGKDEKEMLDYLIKTLRFREKYYNKAKRIVRGLNLTARKLEKFCFRED